jgi:hypothetical protein
MRARSPTPPLYLLGLVRLALAREGVALRLPLSTPVVVVVDSRRRSPLLAHQEAIVVANSMAAIRGGRPRSLEAASSRVVASSLTRPVLGSISIQELASSSLADRSSTDVSSNTLVVGLGVGHLAWASLVHLHKPTPPLRPCRFLHHRRGRRPMCGMPPASSLC